MRAGNRRAAAATSSGAPGSPRACGRTRSEDMPDLVEVALRAEMHAHRHDVDVERLEHRLRQVGRGIDDDRDLPARGVMRHLLLALHVVGFLAGDRAEARGELEELAAARSCACAGAPCFCEPAITRLDPSAEASSRRLAPVDRLARDRALGAVAVLEVLLRARGRSRRRAAAGSRRRRPARCRSRSNPPCRPTSSTKPSAPASTTFARRSISSCRRVASSERARGGQRLPRKARGNRARRPSAPLAASRREIREHREDRSLARFG